MGKQRTYAFAYNDRGAWKDQLTKVTYTGYYVLNQQGDVIGIIDAQGNVLVRYYYNAWGLEVAEYTGARSADHLLRQYNALKYRGYYYDAEWILLCIQQVL